LYFSVKQHRYSNKEFLSTWLWILGKNSKNPVRIIIVYWVLFAVVS
jgi:hypothetical protein